VREYAHERLAASGELETVERRHAEAFLELAETARPQLEGPDSGVLLDRLETEHDNVRRALATFHRDDPERCLKLAATMGLFWNWHNHFQEGRGWLAAALERGADAPAEVRIGAIYHAVSLSLLLGDLVTARGRAEEVIELAEAIGDKHRLGASTYQLGVVDSLEGNLATARGHFERGLALGRELGYAKLIGHCLNSLGEVARMEGDLATARDHYEQVVTTMRGTKDDV